MHVKYTVMFMHDYLKHDYLKHMLYIVCSVFLCCLPFSGVENATGCVSPEFRGAGGKEV